MENAENILNLISQNIWMVMMYPLLGVGLYLTFGLRLMTLIKIPSAFKKLLSKESSESSKESGEISSFKAVSIYVVGLYCLNF